jgi:hypothetical protein
VLDQLGNAGRIGVVGITSRDVVHVGRVEQPALHLVLEEVPDRLPVAPGRLHPHPGHPVSWPATRPAHQARGGRGEPAGLGVAPTMAVGHPHAGGGARGSHVRLISGLVAPSSTNVGLMTSPFLIRRGWPSTAIRGLSDRRPSAVLFSLSAGRATP